MTKEEVIKTIQEEIEKNITIGFECVYHSVGNSKYTVNVFFKNELIASDYQIIKG